MTGYIRIKPGVMPEDLPEDAECLAYAITGNAVLTSFERIAVVYNLGLALGYGEEEWSLLQSMAAHEPPFDGLFEQSFGIGGTMKVPDDDE